MKLEVIVMENENHEIQEQELPEEEIQQTPAEPRPTWQRVGAWIILVLFCAVVAMYYVNMFRGGR